MHTNIFGRTMRCVAASVFCLAFAARGLSAQDQIGSRSMRLTAISGGLTHISSLVVDPAGKNDTRLTPGATFGLDLQFPALSFASIYASVAGSFSTLEHGSNLGVIAGSGSSATTVILGTAGLVFANTSWFDSFMPTLRLGGGMKLYNFSTNGASSYAAPTADIGAGFRAGSGAIEVAAEVRFLPSAFDQGKLPLRGLTAQDQQQNDLMFTIGVTVRP